MRLTDQQTRAIDALNTAHKVGHRWLGGAFLAEKLNIGPRGLHRTMASLVRRRLATREVIDGRVCYRLADKLREAGS